LPEGAAWQAAPSGKPGGQQRYADIAIEAALTVRMVFHQPMSMRSQSEQKRSV
jgi:hypothetical protein